MNNKRGRKVKMINYDNAFAVRLRMLMCETNVTQQEIADAINFTRQAVSGWEIGRTTPDIFAVSKIADFFKVSVDYLIGKTNVRSKNNDVVEHKPCPFCGSKSITLHKDFMIQCDGCQTVFAQPQTAKPQSMLEVWNRRVEK